MFCLESYLKKLPKLYRISLSRLRTNNDRLPIVTGRYTRIPREERKCDKCNANAIGEEFHVLLECNNQEITELRTVYLPRYYRNNPSRYKFLQLLQSERYTVQRKVVVFVKSVFNIFQ